MTQTNAETSGEGQGLVSGHADNGRSYTAKWKKKREDPNGQDGQVLRVPDEEIATLADIEVGLESVSLSVGERVVDVTPRALAYPSVLAVAEVISHVHLNPRMPQCLSCTVREGRDAVGLEA